jgi:hypothetical protein
MVLQIYAGLSKAAGDSAAACMFQRAAHLSLASVMRWQNPTGELQIVKNHFPARLRWGYEAYRQEPYLKLCRPYYFVSNSAAILLK